MDDGFARAQWEYDSAQPREAVELPPARSEFELAALLAAEMEGYAWRARFENAVNGR